MIHSYFQIAISYSYILQVYLHTWECEVQVGLCMFCGMAIDLIAMNINT